MTDDRSLRVHLRDGMFDERAGIEGWPRADAAIRTHDWASLNEIVNELKTAGFPVHPVVFASGTFASPAAEVLLGGIGGLAGLAAILRAWVHRHDGKKIHFEFNGQQVDLEGLSEDELADVLRSLSNFKRGQPRQGEATEEADGT